MPDDIAAPSAGACRISIGGAPAFEAARNELLLLAALRQGVDYPHNCRVGTCGSCKTRLLRGRISPMVDFALSPLSNRELKEGYILACQAKVRGDLELEVQLGRQHIIAPRTVSSRVVGWRRLPGEVIDLRLRLDQPLPYRAGQYCTIAESGSFVRRSYSFYDPPPDPAGEGAVEVGFLVKRLPGGRFSEWLFAADRRGTKVWLEGPFGAMGVEEYERDSLCVAGGTGLAPILSILGERIARSAASRHTLVFGVRSSRDGFATAALEALQRRAGGRLRVLTILSHEPADSGWDGPRGLATDALDGLGLDYRALAAFACGSAGMVAAVEARLLGLGVAPERIHADRFIPTG
jgi:NAD(P)H-flavin reductase/ferredoxin